MYFIFLKNLYLSFNTNFRPQWKDWKIIYQVRQILVLFCNLIALILGWNSVKVHRVTKIVKEIKFEGVWRESESRRGFYRQSFTKYLTLTLVFMWNTPLREKFSFKRFLLLLTKFWFWQSYWALGYPSMKFRHFVDIS